MDEPVCQEQECVLGKHAHPEVQKKFKVFSAVSKHIKSIAIFETPLIYFIFIANIMVYLKI